MLKTIFTIIAVLSAAVLIFASTKPDTFQVQREASIKAPPEKIYAYLEDFHKWSLWSPWEKMDPDMTRTHSGADHGLGAVYEWGGNKKVGEGRMKITEADAPNRLKISLDFLEPFEVHNTAEFTLEPNGDSTNVIWLMSGPSPYMSKVVNVFFDMGELVGKDFDTGLASLKKLAEK